MMVQRKRHYVPKVRGCHECSQRRIHCDRGSPSCAKCMSKGIQCSGLGIRYRFSDDVPSKCKPGQTREFCATQLDSSDRKQAPEHVGADGFPNADVGIEDSIFDDFLRYCEEKEQDTNFTDADFAAFPFNAEVETLDLENSSLVKSIPGVSVEIPSSPADTFGTWTRHLLQHFSKSIASELVVIDDGRNGWRHLVLPVAYQDELVREAVLAAAALHFSSNIRDGILVPEAIYAKAIRLLHERQNLNEYDLVGKQTVLLALLVFLSSVMISGSSDFPMIFNLLESALTAVGGEDVIGHNEMGVFILRQIRKYRGYASPFLSQAGGLTRLRHSSSFGQTEVNGWDCFNSSYKVHPELAGQMSIIYDLNQQACEIYVQRAMKGADGQPLNDLVCKFIRTLDRLPMGFAGEHVLVFATFLVALESALPEHQEYFTNTIMRHYKRNGFNNLLTALDHLKRVWSGPAGMDWTKNLPSMQVFIV